MAISRSQWFLLGSVAIIAVLWVVSLASVDYRALEDDHEAIVGKQDTVALDDPDSKRGVMWLVGLGEACIQTRFLRWIWWPTILYLFWGMGYICDVYFVRTIEVIAERFQIPDDVAGATLMALGCNGPELALNTISIFHPSDIGVGAVIGGEVFNVLVIIGTALLATPAMYMPLKVGVFSFTRDLLFYVVSLIQVYLILKDRKVEVPEALSLIFGAVCYSTTVTFSSPLRDLCDALWIRAMGRLNFLATGVARLRRRRNSTGGGGPNPLGLGPVDDAINDSDDDDNTEDAMLKELQKAERVGQWLAACRSTDPTQGSVLGVRAEVRSRIADRTHHFEQRYVLLKEEVLMVSAAVGPQQIDKMHMNKEVEDLMVYDYDSHTKHHHWHYGGLVNQLIYLNDPEAESIIMGKSRAKSAVPTGSDQNLRQRAVSNNSRLGEEQGAPATPTGSELFAPLLTKRSGASSESPKRATKFEDELPQTVTVCDLMDAPWEVIPLEDILYIEPPTDPEHLVFTIHVHQHDSHLGTMITLEMEAAEANVLEKWVDEVTSNIKKLRRHTTTAPTKAIIDDIMEWVEWVQFPVKFGLKMTIPDMDNHSKQHLYPVSFVMSMSWLALFAFFVTAACDGLHEDFDISTTVLGFTLAAAGTSFPNVFSGMVVAQQGKTTMAIANALGANVQNVFLALAIPWSIRALQSHNGYFILSVKDLKGSIIMCFITLLPVVLVVWSSKFQVPKWSGALFLMTYCVYLVFAMGQEITDCMYWPFMSVCEHGWMD